MRGTPSTLEASARLVFISGRRRNVSLAADGRRIPRGMRGDSRQMVARTGETALSVNLEVVCPLFIEELSVTGITDDAEHFRRESISHA